MTERPRAKLIIVILLTAGVVSAWAAASFLGDALSLDLVASTLEATLSRYTQALGIQATYAGASPSIFSGLSLRDIVVRRGERVVLSVRRVRLDYSLWSLIRGKPGLDGITVTGLAADIDLEQDRDSIDGLLDMLKDGGGQLGRLELALEDVTIGVRGPGLPPLSAKLRRADLLSAPDGSLSVSGSGQITLDTGTSSTLGTITAPFALTGSMNADASSALVSAKLAAESPAGRLREIRVLAGLDGSRANLSVHGVAGIRELGFEYDTAAGTLGASADFDDWRPSSVLSLGNAFKDANQWLESTVTGTLAVSTDFSLDGTRIGASLSGRLPLGLPGGRASYRLRADGTAANVAVAEARIASPGVSLSYSGQVFPAAPGASGSLDLVFAPSGTDALEASFSIEGRGLSWRAASERLGGDVPALENVVVTLDSEGQSLTFGLEADAVPPVRSEPDPAAIPRPRLTLEGRAALGRKPYIEAALSLDNSGLGWLASLLPDNARSLVDDYAAGLSIESSLSFFSDLSTFSFGSPATVFSYDGPTPARVELSFKGNSESAELGMLDARIGDYVMTGSGSVDYSSPQGLSFDANFKVQDIPYDLAGSVLDRSLFIQGAYGLLVSLKGTGTGTSASLVMDSLPVALAGEILLFTVDAGALLEGQTWQAVLSRFEATPSDATTARLPSVSMSGSFDQNGGSLHDMKLADRFSSLEGGAEFIWPAGGGASASLNLANDGGESYQVTASYSDGRLDVDTDVKRAALARLGLPVLTGVMDANLRAKDILGQAEANFTFTVNGGQRNDDAPFATGRGTFANGALELTDTRLSYLMQTVDSLSMLLRPSDWSFGLTANAALSLGDATATGALSAEGALQADGGYLIRGSFADFSWENEPVGTWPFAVELGDQVLVATLGANGEAYLRLTGQGDIQARLDPVLPLSFDASGRVSGDTISLDLRSVALSMPALFRFLGEPFIQASSGVARGNLAIHGPVSDPDIEGRLDMDNVYLVLPELIPEPIGPLLEPLYFTGRTMETDQPTVLAGGATLRASLYSTIRSWAPDDMTITAATTGTDLVPVSSKLLGLGIEGMANADVTIRVQKEDVDIQGTVRVAKGDISITTGVFAGGDGEEDSYGLSLALDLGFGASVRVYFPDRNLPLIYGQTDPSSKLAVSFDGSSGDFSLKGRAQLRGGSVFYIQRNFYLKSATIDFNESSQSFDPTISLSAETRSRNEYGPVLVLLSASSSRLSNLVFKLESVPGMSEAEIAQLLGLELLGAEDGQPDLWKALVGNSDLLPRFNVVSVFERNVQDLLGLDLFFVRTQVLQRWLYDLSGLNGAAEVPGLSDYLDNTAITAGKYLGEDLYLQLLLRLQEQELASGTGLRLDSEISLEWQAPHFLLQWSFRPENPDSLFVTDNTFSLFWRIPLK